MPGRPVYQSSAGSKPDRPLFPLEKSGASIRKEGAARRHRWRRAAPSFED